MGSTPKMSFETESQGPNEYIKDFFPATSSGFIPRCGEISSVRASDFNDVHRRRHLESFQKSWTEWMTYDTSERNHVPEGKAEELVSRLIDAAPKTQIEFNELQRSIMREMKIHVSKSQMLAAFEKVASKKPTEVNLEQFLVKKGVRTHSGVVVITVLTSPGSFSCPKDCFYCPNEPGQPRSYLSTEPAVLRANQNGWDSALQFWDRASTLYHNGHIIDKIEVLVLGGTWSGYPKAYQEDFVRDLFYAANTFKQYLECEKRRYHTEAEPKSFPIPTAPDGLRARLTLEEEQRLNEDATCRIIGLTLETRPDHISKGELRRLRRFGCTRVQIGIQHTDDEILEKINRGCTRADGIRAIQLLKDGCFKVDIHLMPDLPGSSPEQDRRMFEWVLSSPQLQADQWKIYPCEVTPFSQIEQWYKQGIFVPYAEEKDGRDLIQLLVKVKTAVHPWIRLNRVVRDIPNPSIIAGNDRTNLRQVLLSCMDKRGLQCRCLRCREVKNDILDTSMGCLKVRRYFSQGGEEYFISFETKDESKLFGFLRLRLRNCDLQVAAKMKSEKADPKLDLSTTFRELVGSGLIRELHVYGKVVGSHEQKCEGDKRPQHTGFGRRLLVAAEMITLASGMQKMAVIAGIGTRNYYRKFGYEIEEYFMTKSISKETVARWANDLGLKTPINIQCYNTTTDLGQLGDGLPQFCAPVEQGTLDVPKVILKERGGRRYRHNRSITFDILDPFGNNCSCLIQSRTVEELLVFLDHVETLKPTPEPFFSTFNVQKILKKIGHTTSISWASTFVALGCFAIVWWRQRK